MFRKLKIAYRKVHSFLFGEEIEHIHTREERKHYYGRIKNTDNDAEARMIHQYPKKGKFRFPVSVDDRTIHINKNDQNNEVVQHLSQRRDRQQPLEHNDNRKQTSIDYTVKNYERKKFQGVNFKARNIPSPVYAFAKPPQKNKHITFEVEQEVAVAKIDEEITLLRESDTQLNGTNSENFEYELEIETDGAVVGNSQECEDTINDEEKCENTEPIVHPTPKIEGVVKEKVEQTPRKTIVPFNVLMLQKDRHAQKKNLDENINSYQFPTLQLLNIPDKKQENHFQWLDEKKEILEKTLINFNVNAKVIGVTKGPSVTRFEIQPEAGVKVSKVTTLTDDIKLSLAAKDIRIEAPIPGRNAIGIEVPNDVCEPVVIREILRSKEFQQNQSPLTICLGLDISGKPIVTDIQKMPHGLIAGSTGSGKSVCINSILISIMFKATPDEVKLMLIDPKMVELAPYNDIPHLVTPVITDAKQATSALKWAVEEMERRYELFVQNGVRDIKRYNQVMINDENPAPAMPYIVIIIDELADLMMVSAQDVEDAICRIAQKARACGIHLLVATQRPSVDVITGLIKANIPTRIAFSVSSQADSRTIIDSGGAERLLGKGDMLFFENGASKPIRVQGNFVSDDEIDRVIELVKKQRKPNYFFDKESLIKTYDGVTQEDDLFEEACYYVIEQGAASSSSLQRRFRVGFNRAARLIDMMEARGIISEAMGSKPRNVLVSAEELPDLV